MSYRQPGVKAIQEKNTSFVGTSAGYLPVAVVGSGRATLRRVYKVVKTADAYSAIKDSDGDYVKISSIIRIGNTINSTDYNITGHTSDYSKSTQTIDAKTVDVVLWEGGAGDATPATNSTFYVEIEETPADKHYELKIMSSKSQITAEYGPNVDDTGAINNIALAAEIVLQNTGMVYVRKAKKAGTDITALELQTAVDDLKGNSDVYRIICADAPKAALNNVILGHVRLMSDPEEQRERVSMFATEHSSASFSDVLTNVGGYAEALNEYRVAVVYPDKAKITLDDGNKYTVGGQFITAAIASLKASLKPEEALTGKQITNFEELVGISMTRTEKNLLAGKGVMLLTQEKASFPIEIRHGLSTDMSSIQMREMSITELADYMSRLIRPALKNYVGQNINASLLTRMDGSVTSVLNAALRAGHINAGSKVIEVVQLADSPDSVAVKVRIFVPYPCNYIDVTIAYD